MKASSFKSLFVMTGLVATLAACSPQQTAPVSTPPAETAPAPTASSTPPAAEPVTAAPAAAAPTPSQPPAGGKPSAPVSIALLAHADTVTGSPADLVVTITPTSAVDRVSGEISAGEGLTMNPVTFDLSSPTVGSASRQSVQVIRNGAGTGFLRVKVQSHQGEATQTKILLLAVNGGESVAPKPTAPVQTLPNGDRIISMPLEETTK